MIAFTSQGRLVKAPIHRSSHIQDHQGHAHNQVIVKRMSWHQLSSNIYEKSIRESNDFYEIISWIQMRSCPLPNSFGSVKDVRLGLMERSCALAKHLVSPYEGIRRNTKTPSPNQEIFRWYDLDSAHLTIKCTRL